MLNCWAPIGRGDASTIASRSQELEQRYTGVIGNQVYGPPWASLAVAATSTSSLKLETGIAMAFVRSPFETACAALELDQISNGRFHLVWVPRSKHGLKKFLMRTSNHQLGECVNLSEILRRILTPPFNNASSLPDYHGKYYQLSLELYTQISETTSEEFPYGLLRFAKSYVN